MIANFYIGNIATAGGTADVITADYVPVPTILVDKMLLYFRALGANTTTTPTFSPNNLTAHTIVKQGGVALAAGDIPDEFAVMEVCYDEANTRWELINPAIGVLPYKVYKARLSQSGTDDPTATELQNNVGGAVVWTRDSVGSYSGTLVGAFAGNAIAVNQNIIRTTPFKCVQVYALNSDVISVVTVDANSNVEDGLLDATPIEIQVFP